VSEQDVLTKKELTFLIETMIHSQQNYEDRSIKYSYGSQPPDYYKNIYKPTIQQYKDVISKLRRMRKSLW